MAQQQIITKPYVEELQDNDSLFINHDGALRQIKKSVADFASGADMRAEVTAREAFEAQELAAREAFEKSETEAREQFETSVEGQITEKANIDGYYEEMTVGDAEQLVATQFVEDNKPYLFRHTGGSSDVGNRAYLDKIVGGTVVWNQLVQDGNFTDASSWTTSNATMTVSNNTGTVTQNNNSGYINKVVNTVSGHRYLAMVDIKGVAGKTYTFNGVLASLVADGTWQTRTGMFTASRDKTHLVVGQKSEDEFPVEWQIRNACTFDLTQMFGSTIADYIYSLEQSQAGAGVAWFKKLFPKDYYEYNAGELLSVEGLQSHDTVGFNQWDEEWEVGSYDSDGLPIASTDKIRTKNKISVQPSTAYHFKNGGSGNLIIFWYDDNDTVISYEYMNNAVKISPANAKYLRFRTNNYGTTYKNDICVNISDPSRNGEYEPYEKHSYPLDSSLTLRGIPKLDASNNLYYDGDEYTSDGKVKRKYGVVDLGTLNWRYGYNVFYCFPPKAKSHFGGICTKYLYVLSGIDGLQDKQWGSISGNGHAMWVRDNSYTDVATFKKAMSGVMLVYELATPTTETAEPFHNIQIVDDYGTEEFVSTGIVPVGHSTRYPANLRDKLQHLPSLASADGTYLIQQSGKQMSLIHMPAVFPDTPTEDGTYTLKTVVTGGVATLQWVVE